MSRGKLSTLQSIIGTPQSRFFGDPRVIAYLFQRLSICIQFAIIHLIFSTQSIIWTQGLKTCNVVFPSSYSTIHLLFAESKYFFSNCILSTLLLEALSHCKSETRTSYSKLDQTFLFSCFDPKGIFFTSRDKSVYLCEHCGQVVTVCVNFVCPGSALFRC